MEPYGQGVFPAVITQLKRDQSLDLDAAAQHGEVLTKSAVPGLVMCVLSGDKPSVDLNLLSPDCYV